MEERQCQAYYRELVKALNYHELSWVVEQVNEEIQRRKIIKQTVQERRRKPLEIITTSPYTPCERLSLLLDAIEHAVIHSSDIGKYVRKFFSDQRIPVSEIRFHPDNGSIQGENLEDVEEEEFESSPFTFMFSSVADQNTEELKDLLSQLRGQIGNGTK